MIMTERRSGPCHSRNIQLSFSLVTLLLIVNRHVSAANANVLFHSSVAVPDCNGDSPSRYHALVCWLWNAQVTLPNEQFHQQMFTISVTNMACTHFQLSSLISSSSPSSQTTNSALHMDLRGLSASCTGTYDVGLGMSGTILTTVASSDRPQTLDWDMASAPLHPDTPTSLRFPTNVTLSYCQSNVMVSDLQFTGSISAKIISLFSGLISQHVTTALNDYICTSIQKNGESHMNQGLHSAADYLRELMKERQESRNVNVNHDSNENVSNGGQIRTIVHHDFVRWDKDMPLVKRFLLRMNAFLSQHLNEGILLKLLKQLPAFNAWNSMDCENCGFFFKGVNGLIQSLTHDNSDTLEVVVPITILPIPPNHTFAIANYGTVTMAVQKIKVYGLDNFTKLSLAEPVNDNMISSMISSHAGWNLSILMTIEVKPTHEGIFRGELLNESFEVKLNTSHINFTSETAIELDAEIYRKLTVGSFIFGSYTEFDNHRNILNCVTEALTSLVVTTMQVRLNLDAMYIMPFLPSSQNGESESESLEDNIDQLMNTILQMILSEYPVTVTESIAVIIQSPVRTLINDFFANFITSSKSYPLHCINIDIPNKNIEQPLHLDSNKAIMLIDQVVNQETMIHAINSFIECVDRVIRSTYMSSDPIVNVSLGEYEAVLENLEFDNTNSLYELTLLRPEVDHYHLRNDISYAKCKNNETDGSCDMTSVSFRLTILHSKRGVIGNIHVHAKIMSVKFNGGTELKFDMNWLPHVKISDLLSHYQCLSIPATDFRFYGFNSSVEMLEVDIDVNVMNQENVHSFTYRTTDSTELANHVSSLLQRGAVLLEETITKASGTIMKESMTMCASPVNPQRSNTSKRSTAIAGLWTLLILVILVVGNVFLFRHEFKKNDTQEDVVVDTAQDTREDSGEVDGEEEVNLSSMTEPLLNDGDELNEVLEVETPRKFPFASSSSLMLHPSIDPLLKYFLPALLVFAFILFIFSNVSIGASVDLLITRANGTSITSLINIYEFSLVSTMREMFQAGVYLLMLLILFCSGIWPYIKLIALLFSWMASTRRLPPVQREEILYYIDALGKFSLIDAYVLVLMMVAFRYQLEVADVGALNVYVTPKVGFYSFLLATIVSLLSGHAMLFLHRKTMLPVIAVYSGRCESLSKHIFEDKHGRGLVKLTKKFRRTTVFVILLTFILLCVGANLKSFHFAFTGIAGTALGESSKKKFSLVSIGHYITHSVQYESSFGIHWIQTCYFFFALVMPLVCLVSLFVLFTYPMTIISQQKWFMLAEISNAWSAVEVFVIAILVSLIEIEPFSDSIVDTHCSILNKILSGWSEKDGDGLHHCFGVKSNIDGSATVLIIAVLLNSFLISTLHRFMHHAIWERIEREDRPDAPESESKTVRECVLAHKFVSRLRKSSRLNAFIFDNVSFGPHSEYEMEFENVVEDVEPNTATFWSEWRKIVSVI